MSFATRFERFLKKERRIWHSHFLPSLGAALAAALVTLVFKATLSNVILFASIGASAFILTNAQKHHLTKLNTTVRAYIIAIAISALVYFLNQVVPLHLSFNIFMLVFLVGLGEYSFDAIHPPAISASLSFVLLQRPPQDLIYLFLTIFGILVIVRLSVYLYSQHLTVNEFMHEFRKNGGK